MYGIAEEHRDERLAALLGLARDRAQHAPACSPADPSGRCPTRRARTPTRRSRRSAAPSRAPDRARSAVDRSDSSTDVTFGHRCFSSGMNVAARRRDPPAAGRVENRQIQDLRVARHLQRHLVPLVLDQRDRLPAHLVGDRLVRAAADDVGERVEVDGARAVQPGARLRAQDPLDRRRRAAPAESRPTATAALIPANAAPSSGECRTMSLPALMARTAASPGL